MLDNGKGGGAETVPFTTASIAALGALCKASMGPLVLMMYPATFLWNCHKWARFPNKTLCLNIVSYTCVQVQRCQPTNGEMYDEGLTILPR